MMGVSKKPQQGKLENICNNKNEKIIYQNFFHTAEGALNATKYMWILE